MIVFFFSFITDHDFWRGRKTENEFFFSGSMLISSIGQEDGCLVSTNIAPATATASVVSNKLFALAYKGQHHFKPLEVSQQETSILLLFQNSFGILLGNKSPNTSIGPKIFHVSRGELEGSIKPFPKSKCSVR